MQVTQMGSYIEQGNRMAYVAGGLQKLTIPTYDGSGQAVHPSVVYIPGGFGPAEEKYYWWMCMTPFPYGNDDYENPSILASNDRRSWVVPAGMTNPLVPAPTPPAYNRDGELLYDGISLHLYWTDSTGGVFRKTLSNNSSTWSAATNIVSVASITGGTILKFGVNDYRCIKEAPLSGGRVAFQVITSTDGINFKDRRYMYTNLVGITAHSSTFIDGSGIHFLVSVIPPGEVAGRNGNLYYGYAEHNSSFITFDTTPILSQEMLNHWTNGTLYKSSMVQGDNQTLEIFVSAYRRGNTEWGIGVVPIKTNNPKRSFDTRGQIRKIRVFEGTQIRDTVTQFSDYLEEFQIFKNKEIWIHSDHDQAVEVGLYARFRSGETVDDYLYYGAGGTALQTVSIPATQTYRPAVLDSSHISALGKISPVQIKIGLKPAAAPTAGSLTMYLVAYN